MKTVNIFTVGRTIVRRTLQEVGTSIKALEWRYGSDQIRGPAPEPLTDYMDVSYKD
jgi:hypothetical protein